MGWLGNGATVYESSSHATFTLMAAIGESHVFRSFGFEDVNIEAFSYIVSNMRDEVNESYKDHFGKQRQTFYNKLSLQDLDPFITKYIAKLISVCESSDGNFEQNPRNPALAKAWEIAKVLLDRREHPTPSVMQALFLKKQRQDFVAAIAKYIPTNWITQSATFHEMVRGRDDTITPPATDA